MGACNSSENRHRPGGTRNEPPSYSVATGVDEVDEGQSTVEVHKGPVLGIAARGDLIASCGDDKTISISSSKLLQANRAGYKPLSLTGHSKAVNRVVFDDNTTNLFSASRDLSIKMWRGDNFEPAASIPDAHTLNISAIATHSSHPHKLFSGSRDYGVKIWDLFTASEGVTAVAEYRAPRNIVTALTTCQHEPDLLYQGSEDLCVRVWDTRQSAASVPAMHIMGYVYFPLCLDRQQRNAGCLLATGCKGFNAVGCGVTLWDVRRIDKPVMTGTGHSQDVTAVQFGRWRGESVVYSCSKDGSLRLWDVTSGEQVGYYRFPGQKLLSSLTRLERSSVEEVEEVAVGAMDGSLSLLSISERAKPASSSSNKQHTSGKQTQQDDDSALAFQVRPVVATAITVARE